MSTNQFTEDSYEQTLIDLFQRMGYQYECGYDVERDFREPWYVADLQQSLRKLNPKMSDEVLTEAYRIVTHVNEGTLEQRNEQMMDYLQNGVEVKFVADIPGAVPNTSTIALTNATLRYVLALADKGWQQACRDDRSLARGLNMVDGRCTYEAVAKVWGLPYTPWHYD